MADNRLKDFTKKEEEKEAKQVKGRRDDKPQETLIRIMATDIPGSRNVYGGLTWIKGVSFAISNAVCKNLKLDKNRKISSLTEAEIKNISEEIKNPRVAQYMKNRRNDLDTGETRHLSTNDLDFRKEFDIKRLRKIKSYKGLRHSRGLPVRGQRTKSHFRTQGKKNKAVGVQKKKEGK